MHFLQILFQRERRVRKEDESEPYLFLLANYMYTVQFLYTVVTTILLNASTQLCQLFGRKFRCNRLWKAYTLTKNQFETGSRSQMLVFLQGYDNDFRLVYTEGENLQASWWLYPLFLNSNIKRARNVEKEKMKDEELLKRKIPVDRLYTGKRIKRLP